MVARVVDSIAALKDLAGREIAVTDWLTVTQERIRQFAGTTEDRQWIHVDPERAKRESPYGTTIAHGFLTLSLMSYFLGQAVEVRGLRMSVNYGLNRVRFPAAVPAGSRIRARVALNSAKDFPEGCEAIFSITIEREGSAKPCCAAEWVVRFYTD
jgi:acyl dehydratase